MAMTGAIVVAATAWARMMPSAPCPTPDKALPAALYRLIPDVAAQGTELPPFPISMTVGAELGSAARNHSAVHRGASRIEASPPFGATDSP
jgi:hypothetical protein